MILRCTFGESEKRSAAQMNRTEQHFVLLRYFKETVLILLNGRAVKLAEKLILSKLELYSKLKGINSVRGKISFWLLS